jgi:diadenosine tetraphosphate (Ap4A) HIT family hydrolase
MSYDSQNVFAKILRGDIPCAAFYEDEFALAFRDIEPAAPVHVLVIPKGEFTSYHDFMASAGAEMIAGFFNAVHQVATQAGVDETGYRLITNHGADASQSVPHFHVHVLGGTPLGGLIPGDGLVR